MKHSRIHMKTIAQRSGTITKKNRAKRIKAVQCEPSPVPANTLHAIVTRMEDAPNITCAKCLNTGFTGGRIQRTDDECFCTPPNNHPKAIRIETQCGDSPNPYSFGLALGLRMLRDVVEQEPVPLILTGEQFVAQPQSRIYWLRLNLRRKAVAKKSALQEAEIAA